MLSPVDALIIVGLLLLILFFRVSWLANRSPVATEKELSVARRTSYVMTVLALFDVICLISLILYRVWKSGLL